ncbi:hypothetical protein EMIT079MI2_300032 [Bacillus sp. IT-79MI2]|uniref:YopX family protein n=1 Tax=Bacillus sp. IT-79MI2 TaxID=3026438 RepID=UPI0039E1A804
MRAQKYQAYITDWEGVTKSFELNGLFFESLIKDKSKVVFKNSVGDIETLLVEHKNIRQYTGLNDQNGTGIFEKDIVHTVGVIPGVEIDDIGIVKFINGSYVVESLDGTDGWELFEEGAEVEVLGNVFEDGELLNGCQETKSNQIYK